MQSEIESVPLIALAGPPQSGKKWVATAIQSALDTMDTDGMVTLSTKYYTAQAEITMLSEATEHYRRIHALIVVIDPNMHQTQQLNHIIDLVDNEESELSPAIKICILNRVAASYGHHIPEEWADWGVENGFEVIAWGYGDKGVLKGEKSNSARLLSNEQDHENDDDEEHGIVRLTDSLKCNHWPNMRMSKPSFVDEAVRKNNQENERQQTEGEQEEVSEEQSEQDIMTMLEQMDQIIAKAKSVREMGSGASDTDRKRMAAETAMELWKMMMGDEDLVSDEEFDPSTL